jgi:nucleoside-diphosphate-sugar epimerase
MTDAEGRPVKRNFVHVEDLVDAIVAALDHPGARRETFNICMDEPVDYGDLGAYLNATRGLPAVEIRTPYHSVWLDNSKAKLSLGWRPQHDLARMVDEAWAYERAADEPRTVWYPG